MSAISAIDAVVPYQAIQPSEVNLPLTRSEPNLRLNKIESRLNGLEAGASTPGELEAIRGEVQALREQVNQLNPLHGAF